MGEADFCQLVVAKIFQIVIAVVNMSHVGVAHLAANVVEKPAGVGKVGIKHLSCPRNFLRRLSHRIRVFAPGPRIFCDSIFQQSLRKGPRKIFVLSAKLFHHKSFAGNHIQLCRVIRFKMKIGLNCLVYRNNSELKAIILFVIIKLLIFDKGAAVFPGFHAAEIMKRILNKNSFRKHFRLHNAAYKAGFFYAFGDDFETGFFCNLADKGSSLFFTLANAAARELVVAKIFCVGEGKPVMRGKRRIIRNVID